MRLEDSVDGRVWQRYRTVARRVTGALTERKSNAAPVRLELTTFRCRITVGRCNQLSHGARYLPNVLAAVSTSRTVNTSVAYIHCSLSLGLLLFGGRGARLPRGNVGISILAGWKRRTLTSRRASTATARPRKFPRGVAHPSPLSSSSLYYEVRVTRGWHASLECCIYLAVCML